MISPEGARTGVSYRSTPVRVTSWPLAACLVTGAVKVKLEGHCRMCGRPARVRALTRHHLVPQRWFDGRGRRLRALMNAGPNVVPLCRSCHDRIDNRDDCRERREARRELRVLLTVAELAFVIQMRGGGWLESTYPTTLDPVRH